MQEILKADIIEAARNPVAALKYLKTMRWRAKLYTHLKEIFINQEYTLLVQKLKPGTTLIDIGAFVGDSAVYFAMQPEVARVIAYEPIPGTFREGNVLLSGAPIYIRKKIAYLNIGIGSETNYTTVKDMVGSGTTALSKSASRNGKRIKVFSLKKAISDARSQTIAIKCDVEGDEYGIFGSVSKSSMKNVYAVIAEVHGHKSKRNEFASAMRGLGYKIEELESSENTALYRFLK